MTELEDIIKQFPSAPYLFVGSGISRRYYNLPDWETLLRKFVSKIDDNEYAFNSYFTQCNASNIKSALPQIASLLQINFDKIWYSDVSLRTVDASMLERIKRNEISPFKAELAAYINANSITNENYHEEIELLKKLGEKQLSGIITTNYDCFLEACLPDYKTFVGQNNLIFSSLQGIAEIYKIHGSITDPETLVINQEDYFEFEEKCKYLAAKLMTIFVEYPIIFLGYSLSDPNIQKIIETILDCLTDEQTRVLSNRFIFVEYSPDKSSVVITTQHIQFKQHSLTLTKIELSDFRPLYRAIGVQEKRIPVKTLRYFQELLHNFITVGAESPSLKVTSPDDPRVKSDDWALAIGPISDVGIRGINGISAEDWYRHLILDDLPFDVDDILSAYDRLIKQNPGGLPIFKFLVESNNPHPDLRKRAKAITYDMLLSNTIKRHSASCQFSSINEIWQTDFPLEKKTRLIPYIRQFEIRFEELHKVLMDLFTEYKEILHKKNDYPQFKKEVSTNIKRLIRIYDYIGWHDKI